jgi:hypothetical protein
VHQLFVWLKESVDGAHACTRPHCPFSALPLQLASFGQHAVQSYLLPRVLLVPAFNPALTLTPGGVVNVNYSACLLYMGYFYCVQGTMALCARLGGDAGKHLPAACKNKGCMRKIQ